MKWIRTDTRLPALPDRDYCSVMVITAQELDSWCKRTYGHGFSEVFRQKREAGKISLRRAQFQLAQKNANMAIWLGKQYLDQKDEAKLETESRISIDPLSKSLEEMAKGLESDG